MNNRHLLDDDRIGKLLLKLSLPALFGFAVMTLYNVVDTIFIGHYVGSLGIAGLSIVFPFQMLSMGIGQMTGMGGASLVSRLLGAGQKDRAERALGNAVTATFILSALIMAAGLAAPDFWLRLMGSSETILPYARDYFVVILIGNIIMTFVMTLHMLVTAEGQARVAMEAMIIGAVANIILDAAFIIPLGWGISGAAWATVISEAISVIYLVRFYYRQQTGLRIRLRNLALEVKITLEILAVGAASLARMLATSVSAVFVNIMLVAYGGDLAVSTFGIVNRIMMFAIIPGIVIGQGLQPILGFNYGTGRYDRALRAIKISMIAATICCFVVFIALYFFPEPFIYIFTTDAQLIAQGAEAAKKLFLAIYLVGFMMVGSMIFQSLGKAAASFITSIARPALFLIPLIFLLPRCLGLDGVWYAFPAAEFLTFLLTLVLLIPQIKDLRKKRAAVSLR